MITDVRWFTGRDCIGIVQVVPDHEKDSYRQTGLANFKYYIGLASGDDGHANKVYIADYGTPFDVAAGNTLFRIL